MDGNIAYLIPLVVGLVEVIKRATGLNSKYAPLLSLVLGLLLSGISGFFSTIGELVLSGIIVGLSSSGLYDAVGKPAIEGAEKLLGNTQ